MNGALRTVLLYLLSKRCIGGKHTPEKKTIKSKTKWLGKEEAKEFDKEYKNMINEGFILRFKKKTGKGTGWHMSLNPRKLKELKTMLGME